MRIYSYDRSRSGEPFRVMSISDYVRGSLSFLERRQQDLEVISEQLDIWTNAVRSQTGYAYAGIFYYYL